jgi:alpha-D-ribose 1-methylphosphonate 5-triphosphate synthase subunit PhnH
VLPGFADPTLDSQRVFRGILEAMSHPGRIVDVANGVQAPAPLHPAAAVVCLTLLDFETPLWLDGAAARPEVVAWLRFHCGAPVVERPEAARLALVADALAMPPFDAFDAGSAEYPDRSATLVIQVQALLGGTGRRLAGPGIEGATRLEVTGVPARFWTGVRDNQAQFPRGVDTILSAGRMLAALPRSTRVED